MGGLHDFHVRLETHDPAREVNRSKLRFGVTGRQANNKPFELALGNPIEFFPDNSVMPAFYKIRPLGLNKTNKIA